MSFDLTIAFSVLIVIVVFWLGLVTGYWMHRSAHKDGVTLVDRMRHNEVPYEDDYSPGPVGQKVTGGAFVPMFGDEK